jgi:hypothetical protein
MIMPNLLGISALTLMMFLVIGCASTDRDPRNERNAGKGGSPQAQPTGGTGPGQGGSGDGRGGSENRPAEGGGS